MRGQQDEPESEYAAGSVADRSTAAAEWGRTQAALAPAWSDVQLRAVVAAVGVRIPPADPPADPVTEAGQP